MELSPVAEGVRLYLWYVTSCKSKLEPTIWVKSPPFELPENLSEILKAVMNATVESRALYWRSCTCPEGRQTSRPMLNLGRRAYLHASRM